MTVGHPALQSGLGIAHAPDGNAARERQAPSPPLNPPLRHTQYSCDFLCCQQTITSVARRVLRRRHQEARSEDSLYGRKGSLF